MNIIKSCIYNIIEDIMKKRILSCLLLWIFWFLSFWLLWNVYVHADEITETIKFVPEPIESPKPADTKTPFQQYQEMINKPASELTPDDIKSINAFRKSIDPNAPDWTPEKTTDTAESVGINPCLFWMWQWCFDYEKAVWIDGAQDHDATATSIVQDIIFAATYMVWTVLTLVIIWCGLGYILASKDGKDASTYRKWLINAAIWAILVWWAYAIVRLIQYIANW